jgi:NO-binding membrane sensor protein with MHYT domain
MHATYNPWLVALSVAVAIAVAYTALRLAGRVAEQRSGARLWLLGGAASMGIGIWSMHFIGMLAFSVPIPLRYNVLTTLASLVIAMLTSGFALAVASQRILSVPRLAVGAIFMGSGISAMHYTGMAAIQIMPVITYDPLLVAASIAIAITASFVALWLFFRLRTGQSWVMRVVRVGAAVVMGLAISGMHYTAMAASMLDPTSYCFGGSAFDNSWLAVTIALVALAVLAITLITTVYDLHLESRTRRDAQRLAELNADLQHGKNLLTLATQAAGIACWEYSVAAGEMRWTENEIASLRAEGIDLRAAPTELIARIHTEDAAAAQAALRAAVAEGREVCAARLRIVCPSGRTVHLQAQARLFCDPDGRLERLLGVCWDVSEQVQQEDRQVTLQMQLREASRQAGMAEVATGVLHSVGNVLNSLGISTSLLRDELRSSRVGNVKRVVDMLREQGPHLGGFLETDPRGRALPSYLEQLGEHLSAENAKLRTEAEAIASHVGHIGEIVAAQQTYARRGGLTEEVDVAELINHAISLNFTTEKEVAVRRNFASVPRLMLDRHKLIQILGNLLSNARQALRDQPPGRKVLTVSVRSIAPESIEIEVEDSGVGISTDVLPKLFTFGFTTKTDGHGFGLHASAILAQELGGELAGHSAGVGRGARFTLRLRAAAPDTEAVERKLA